MTNRLNLLIDKMKELNVESIFMTSKANIYYYSGYLTEPHERLVAIFVDQLGAPLLILPEMEKEDAKATGWAGEMLTYDDQTNPWSLFQDYLHKTKRNIFSIGVEKGHFTLERYDQLSSVIPGSKVLDVSNLMNDMRVVKDKKEYAILKKAAVLADFGVEKGIEALQDGASEMEILAHIEYSLKREGIREMSFSTLVLTGEKTASPHGNPGTKQLNPGDFVLFDLGVIYDGYCSDITRTVAYQTISQDQKKVYETVLSAQVAAIQASQIGVQIGQIDQTARQIITDAGYGKYFTHRIGHGLGIDVHEYPSMHGANTVPLKEGMCFTIEPGIYIPGVGGVRIEDDIFMTKNGPEILTSFPKELQIIS
ncbi:Xaa-Pro dipeptidase [Salirhabdus euzebyi]|uniref:Xaa-Pro dipeptidase n=1 Tax=Salirhabdus euzebyi TaxID=394506 RepID=A0A841Q303_9BACI|nr:Xaa-Pro peptidase family protein [Salirhabdus euzebyi]MBB6452108.1 Xaa-Pro dipeptidase [Salirhabdus euzebyi]